jgi:predicted glycosyltransferase
MVTGPFMAEEQRKELRDRARECGVQVRTSIGDSLSHINAADLVVSMAGYNTMSEILRFRKRAIIVPRNGPSAEQRMRATIFQERGLVTMVDPLELTPARLAAEVIQSLNTPAALTWAGMPALHGISTVRNTLLSWLDEPVPGFRSAAERKAAAARGRIAAHPGI